MKARNLCILSLLISLIFLGFQIDHIQMTKNLPFDLEEYVPQADNENMVIKLYHRKILYEIKSFYNQGEASEVRRKLDEIKKPQHISRLTSSQRYVIQLISASSEHTYGLVSKALISLYEATSLIETPIEAHHMISVLELNVGRLSVSIQQLKLCLFYDPTSLPHLHRIGSILILSGNFEEGGFYWREMIRVGRETMNLSNLQNNHNKQINKWLPSFLLSSFSMKDSNSLFTNFKMLESLLGMDGEEEEELKETVDVSQRIRSHLIESIPQLVGNLWQMGLEELSLHLMNMRIDLIHENLNYQQQHQRDDGLEESLKLETLSLLVGFIFMINFHIFIFL